jgi:chromosomal replication initiation ATPase DnaA
MTAEQLVSATSFMFGVDRVDLFGSNRTARVAEARQVLAWALRQANWSLESIGDFLHRDHTTIMYAVRVVERKAERSARFAERLAVLVQPVEEPVNWKARVLALEARVTELEAMLREKAL